MQHQGNDQSRLLSELRGPMTPVLKHVNCLKALSSIEFYRITQSWQFCTTSNENKLVEQISIQLSYAALI